MKKNGRGVSERRGTETEEDEHVLPTSVLSFVRSI